MVTYLFYLGSKEYSLKEIKVFGDHSDHIYIP